MKTAIFIKKIKRGDLYFFKWFYKTFKMTYHSKWSREYMWKRLRVSIEKYFFIDFKKYFEIIKFRKILCYDHKFFIDNNNNNYNEKLNDPYPKWLKQIKYYLLILWIFYCLNFASNLIVWSHDILNSILWPIFDVILKKYKLYSLLFLVFVKTLNSLNN